MAERAGEMRLKMQGFENPEHVKIGNTQNCCGKYDANLKNSRTPRGQTKETVPGRIQNSAKSR